MKHYILHAPPNPTLEYAQGEKIKVPPNTTEIISQGGGSTIDVAKWVAKELGLKHTAIPTTAGTGSEVTKYVVLTVNGKKTTFVDDSYIPDSYILDPNLVVSLPRLHTISSGLDALCQSFESVWSKNATQESLSYAKSAIELIRQNLGKCVDNPEDTRARANMLLAANLSGRAINITKTNVCHAISYPLTDLYQIPHGIACAMTLPYFAKLYTGIDMLPFIKSFNLEPRFFDKLKVTQIAIKSEKLKDCPQQVTPEDILTALNML